MKGQYSRQWDRFRCSLDVVVERLPCSAQLHSGRDDLGNLTFNLFFFTRSTEDCLVTYHTNVKLEGASELVHCGCLLWQLQPRLERKCG